MQQRPNRKHFVVQFQLFGVFSAEDIKYKTEEQEKKQDDI